MVSSPLIYLPNRDSILTQSTAGGQDHPAAHSFLEISSAHSLMSLRQKDHTETSRPQAGLTPLEKDCWRLGGHSPVPVRCGPAYGAPAYRASAVGWPSPWPSSSSRKLALRRTPYLLHPLPHHRERKYVPLDRRVVMHGAGIHLRRRQRPNSPGRRNGSYPLDWTSNSPESNLEGGTTRGGRSRAS